MQQPPPATPQRLHIDLIQHPRGTAVRVIGELDYDTAPELLTTLQHVVAEYPGPVVLDCAEISFCDSSGLNALLRARRNASEHHRPLILVAPSRATVRVLRMTGADAVFGTASTVEEALGT